MDTGDETVRKINHMLQVQIFSGHDQVSIIVFGNDLQLESFSNELDYSIVFIGNLQNKRNPAADCREILLLAFFDINLRLGGKRSKFSFNIQAVLEPIRLILLYLVRITSATCHARTPTVGLNQLDVRKITSFHKTVRCVASPR